MNVKSIIAATAFLMFSLCVCAQSKKLMRLQEKLHQAEQVYEQRHKECEELRKTEYWGDMPLDSISRMYDIGIFAAHVDFDYMRDSMKEEANFHAFSRSDFEIVKTDIDELNRKKTIIDAEIAAAKKVAKLRKKYEKALKEEKTKNN